jgi:hypothetical protein
MSEYTPDRWVVIDITHKGNTVRKVLGGWIGGYAKSDTWRLNSGVTEVKDEGDFYLFSGASGSVYKCWKRNEGMTSLSSSVYASMVTQAAESDSEWEVELVTPFRIEDAGSI